MTQQQPGPGAARRPPPPAPAPAAAPVNRVLLKQATSGLIHNEPLRIVVHGVEGVGKTTLAANAPKCLILGAEDGTAEIPVYGRLVPDSWAAMLDILDQLRTDEHNYRSVAIDTLDWLEPMCWAHVCTAAKKPDIEAFGYGKGYIAALSEWRVFLAKLQALITGKRMNVILIAHSVCKGFKNPDADQGDYDRYMLKLHEKTSGLVKEWAKAVLFCNYERATVEKDGRNKGVDTGKRMMYTRMSAKHDAKNRLWLQAEIPLSWAALIRAIKSGEDLRKRWAEALDKVDDRARAEAQEFIEQEDYDPVKIAETIEGLKALAANVSPSAPVQK